MSTMIRLRRAYQRVITHWRIFLACLIAIFAVFQLIYPDEFGRFLDMAFLAIFVMLIASQFFWVRRVLEVVQRFLPGNPRRSWLAVVTFLIYLFFFIYSYPAIESTNTHVFRAADLRLSSVLIVAIFWWWLVGSWAGFGLVMVFWTADLATRSAAWVYNKVRQVAVRQFATPAHGTIALDPPSPARRRFLERSAVAVGAAPFVAAGYGLLYERLDVEITNRRIRLARLPKTFEGFRIAQLSDLHISPYMTGDELRRCVTLTNATKADLIVMTGDYVTWDPEAQGDAVQALAGLRAPYGVFGCLGNHEEESSTEESITRLFAAQGIRMLRQESLPIRVRGETINLMGIDCPRSLLAEEAEYRRDLNRRLRRLVVTPDTVNILLSHYPGVFDRAAELGIDLTLAGHTHGGQLSLEFIHRGLSLAHFLSRYDSGWYEKPGGQQLYVNRGIGTIGFPIRFGARPEITVLELART
jgi:predicted MPP superfamily phosphohydrolase